jgi:N-dimethylarginine dimethylaminohydrolase
MQTPPSTIQHIWSVNEWGRLREVIVGDPRNAFIPSMDDISQRSFDRLHEEQLPNAISGPMPDWVINETLEDIHGLIQLLISYGVRVHRANQIDCRCPVRTPYWTVDQEHALNIRDMTLIHGNMVVDAPSPTRSRYCESFAVRDLFDDYRSRLNHTWFASPPRPRLLDHTYDLLRARGINNTEPLFDAANCVRLGKDVVVDINNTANEAGADWLQHAFDRHFGIGTVRIHRVSLSPDHIDVIIVPLCHNVAVINPQYVSRERLPSCFSDWELIDAPEMVPQSFHSGTSKASNWIGLNLLVVDGQDRTVIVEERQLPLIRLLEQRGFRPIPIRWRHGRTWGGSFHCVTLDVHRDGEL